MNHIELTIAEVTARIQSLQSLLNGLVAYQCLPLPAAPMEPKPEIDAKPRAMRKQIAKAVRAERASRLSGDEARADCWVQMSVLPEPFTTADIKTDLTPKQLVDLLSNSARKHRLIIERKGVPGRPSTYRRGPNFPTITPLDQPAPAPSRPRSANNYQRKPGKLIDAMRGVIAGFPGTFTRVNVAEAVASAHPNLADKLLGIATNLLDMTDRGELVRTGAGSSAVYTRAKPRATTSPGEANYHAIRQSITVPRELDPEV